MTGFLCGAVRCQDATIEEDKTRGHARYGHGDWSWVENLPRSLHCAVRAEGARTASVGMTVVAYGEDGCRDAVIEEGSSRSLHCVTRHARGTRVEEKASGYFGRDDRFSLWRG